MNRVLLCGLLVCCAATSITAAAVDSAGATGGLTAADVYDDAFHIFASGDEKGVQPVLAQAIQAFPKDAKLTFFYGACYRGYFENERAVPLFQKAADLDGNGIWAEAARSIIGLDMQLGDKEQQFKSLDDLALANPGEPLILWMDAVQCRALKKNDIGAKRYATLLTMVNPGPAIMHQTYANILDALHRYQDALPERRIAVKIQPAGWTYQGLASTLSQLGQWKEADDAYKLATSLNPLDSLTWRNWAWSKRRRGDVKGAQVDLDLAQYATQARTDTAARFTRLEHAAKPQPFQEDATVLYNQAIDAWRKGDQSKTEAVLLNGSEQFSDDARFPFFLGVCFLDQDKRPAADTAFRRAISIDPGGIFGLAADYTLTFANPFESRHNFTGMQNILSRGNEDPVMLWTAAVQAAHLHQPIIGLSYFAKLAPTSDSAPAIVYTQYANCQESLSRYDEALPHRQAAVALDPSADNYGRLAMTLSHLRKWADADSAFEKCTSLDANNPSRLEEWAQSKADRGDSAGAEKLRGKARGLRSPSTRPATSPSSRPATRP